MIAKGKLAAEKERLEREQEKLRQKEEELKKQLSEIPKRAGEHRMNVAVVADGVWESTGTTQTLRRAMSSSWRRKGRQEGLGRFVLLLFVLLFLILMLWRAMPS
ncbi:MAG: hypothetical protein N2035_03900 [Chthoniobacterales bacterium]|nr:hypothetical protein [Chthoniobacterales bacterium]